MASNIVGKLLWRTRKYSLGVGAPCIDLKSSLHSRKRIVVAGLFRACSGIGESARLCAKSLQSRSFEVVCVDLSEAFGQAELPTQRYLVEPSSLDLREPTVFIVHLNAPEFERACFLLGLWRGHKHYVIGYWAWELDIAPSNWQAAERFLSELWTTSTFSKSALQGLTDKPVCVIGHDLETPNIANRRKHEGMAPSCLIMADGKSSFARKNILGSICSFLKGSAGTLASLTVKTRNLEEHPGLHKKLHRLAQEHPRIDIIDENYSRIEVRELLDMSDIMISLHRSEGFGLPLAEAMILGKVVIATAWSGNLDFMTPNNSILVPAQLVEVEDEYGIYRSAPDALWAEADVGVAAQNLNRLINNPNQRQQLGLRASADMAERSKSSRMVDRLAFIVNT